MVCDTCGGTRVLSVDGKCSDLCQLEINGNEYHGYVLGDMNIGNGDYLRFDLCLDCGKVQGEFPVETHKFLNRDETEEE